MRRVILALTLAVGAMPLIAACDSGSETPGAPAPVTAGTPSAAAPSSAAPSVAMPDYAANTKAVCGRLQKIFNDDLEGFGVELGKMIAYKEAKQAPEAEKAEKAAGRQLRGVADKIKKETAAAQDPELRAAGAASAAKFTRSAGDSKLFDRIKSTKDLDRTIEGQMTEWLTPVAGYCP